MISLLIATLLAASFGLIVSWAQRIKANLYAVGAINYGLAMVFHLVSHARVGGWVPLPGTYLIGMLGGLAFVSGFLLLFPAMSLRGVSISTAMLRLAVVVPMLVGWLFWGETLAALPALGAALALASLPLLTWRSDEGLRGLKSRSVVLLLALFLVNGGCMLALRAFSQTGIEGQGSLFLAILFGTAAAIAFTFWWRHRQGTSKRDLPPGILLGLVNALGNTAMIAALDRLSGLLVFPFYSSVGMIFTVLFARYVWGERISRLELGGIGLAVVAVVLANV
jgi:drug/metabolite transporter (DMT)-like permease